MHKHTVFTVAVSLGVGAGLAVLLMPSRRMAPAEAPPPPPGQRPAPRLPKPGHLPEVARGVLERRMERHGADMTELLSSVVLTDWEAAQRRAEAIAGDASLARPLTGDAAELNSQLPEAFFRYQDELRARTKELAAAAARSDAQASTDAFGAVAKACVSCHLAYLKK